MCCNDSYGGSSRSLWIRCSRSSSVSVLWITSCRIWRSTRAITTTVLTIWSTWWFLEWWVETRTSSFTTPFIVLCSRACWSSSTYPECIGLASIHAWRSRGRCDVFSVVDLSPDGKETALKPSSNLVVDTLRIVTGIPQSRMTDILEDKSPVVDGSDDVEALL